MQEQSCGWMRWQMALRLLGWPACRTGGLALEGLPTARTTCPAACYSSLESPCVVITLTHCLFSKVPDISVNFPALSTALQEQLYERKAPARQAVADGLQTRVSRR